MSVSLVEQVLPREEQRFQTRARTIKWRLGARSHTLKAPLLDNLLTSEFADVSTFCFRGCGA